MKIIIKQMLQKLQNSLAQSEQIQIQVDLVKQNQILNMNYSSYKY